MSDGDTPRKSNATVWMPCFASCAITWSQPQSPTPPDSCASTSVVSPFPAVAAYTSKPSLVCSHSVATCSPPGGVPQYLETGGAGDPDAWCAPQPASTATASSSALRGKRDVV